MNQPYNIFIEGIPGSGKSTLLDALARHFTDYRVFREGDISPVELAWCAYMTETEYRQALSDLADLIRKSKPCIMIFMNIWKNLRCTAEEKALRNSETSSFGDSALFIPAAIYLNAPFSRISWKN